MKAIRLRWFMLVFFLFAGAAQTAVAAGRLEIGRAWIRSAPPGAMMQAGYAVLRNSGDALLVISGAHSEDFGDVSLHQTLEENGVERMRALGEVSLAPGASLVFAPGGRHLMLMQPRRELKSGDTVKIHLDTKSGDGATGEFVVRDDAPAAIK